MLKLEDGWREKKKTMWMEMKAKEGKKNEANNDDKSFTDIFPLLDEVRCSLDRVLEREVWSLYLSSQVPSFGFYMKYKPNKT